MPQELRNLQVQPHFPLLDSLNTLPFHRSKMQSYIIQDDGVVFGDTKYFLRIEQPDTSILADMPKAMIDDSKTYHMRVVPVQ